MAEKAGLRKTVKRWSIIFVLAPMAALLVVSACQRAPTVPGQAADDIVPAPGLGPTYRANIQQQGVKNPWPPIQSAEVALGDNVFLSYRVLIDMNRGEAGNDIIWVRTPSDNITGSPEVELEVIGPPPGFEVKQEKIYAGPRAMKQLLVIKVSRNARPGQYDLQMKVVVNGKDYGEIPFTVVLVR